MTSTTISPDRIHLDSGGHNPPKQPPADGGPVELCFNEAVAMLRGEPHSDRPKCVSPVIRDFTLRLNDGLADGPRQRMAGYFDRVVGTAGDGHDPARRQLASQWLMREVLPAWLRLAKLEDLAVKAEAAAGLTGDELTEALRAIRQLTWDVTYERRASVRHRPSAVSMPSAPQTPPLTPAASAQPCQQAFNVAVATAPNGAAWVMVTFYGPCGSWSCFLDPDAAESLAAQLGENVTLARSGLVVARGPLPPPPVNGHGPTIEHRP